MSELNDCYRDAAVPWSLNKRSIFVRSALVSAHGVKNEVYTCVMR